jgi:hypothetical protein
MTQQVTPIRWWNLPWWANRTVRASRHSYVPSPRPLSPRRLARLLVPDLRRPIFLLGAPRSGTTFLGASLAQLPEVSYHHEPVATKAAARCVATGLWSRRKSQRFYRMVYRWLMRIHADGDLRFAEKTPRNAFLVGFLREAFPDAQFVHIVRDGRDAALSYSKKPWLSAASAGSSRREPGGYPYGPTARFWVEPDSVSQFETTSDLHRCIWAWRRHTESILQEAETLSVNQYHEIRYEALVRQPHETADPLLDFLQISQPKSRDRFHQAVDAVDPKSVGGWRDGMTVDQQAVVMTEAGSLLKRLGYMGALNPARSCD